MQVQPKISIKLTFKEMCHIQASAFVVTLPLSAFEDAR